MDYKDWERVYERAKANNINTLGELAMYCKVWKIKTNLEMLVQLGSDYIEVLLERRNNGKDFGLL